MRAPDLVDLMQPPALVRPVEPDGAVVAGEPHTVLRWQPNPKQHYRCAEIELHPADDGTWMWSASFCTGEGGGGYKVGPKWGKFAADRTRLASEGLAKVVRLRRG